MRGKQVLVEDSDKKKKKGKAGDHEAEPIVMKCQRTRAPKPPRQSVKAKPMTQSELQKEFDQFPILPDSASKADHNFPIEKPSVTPVHHQAKYDYRKKGIKAVSKSRPQTPQQFKSEQAVHPRTSSISTKNIS